MRWATARPNAATHSRSLLVKDPSGAQLSLRSTMTGAARDRVRGQEGRPSHERSNSEKENCRSHARRLPEPFSEIPALTNFKNANVGNPDSYRALSAAFVLDLQRKSLKTCRQRLLSASTRRGIPDCQVNVALTIQGKAGRLVHLAGR